VNLILKNANKNASGAKCRQRGSDKTRLVPREEDIYYLNHKGGIL
jgi:hypothetical protein